MARLGVFIFVTLAVLRAGASIIGSKEYFFRPICQLAAQVSYAADLLMATTLSDAQVVFGVTGEPVRKMIFAADGAGGMTHTATPQLIDEHLAAMGSPDRSTPAAPTPAP